MVSAIALLLALGTCAPEASLGDKLVAEVRANIISVGDLWRIQQYLKGGSLDCGYDIKPNWHNEDAKQRLADKGPFEHMVCPISDSRTAWLKGIAASFKSVDVPEVGATNVRFKRGDLTVVYVRGQYAKNLVLLTADFDPARGSARAVIYSVPDFGTQVIDQFTDIPPDPSDESAWGQPPATTV